MSNLTEKAYEIHNSLSPLIYKISHLEGVIKNSTEAEQHLTKELMEMSSNFNSDVTTECENIKNWLKRVREEKRAAQKELEDVVFNQWNGIIKNSQLFI